jgi:hypothetical protein
MTMKAFALLLVGAAAVLAASAWSPAHAIPRTFVSGTGGGAVCSRAAPCATFQLAHDATDAGGEINCVDAGDYGPVTITKSITVDCAGTTGTITVGTGSDAVAVNGGGIAVRLRNVTIQGRAGGAGRGIVLFSGAALFVENCTIIDTNPFGIDFGSNTSAKLFVSDSTISNTQLGGMRLLVGGSATVRALLDGIRVEKNGNVGEPGILAGGLGPGVISAHIRNSVVSGNTGGVAARNDAGGADAVSITLDRSSVTLNHNSGVVSAFVNTFVILGRSAVISNDTGINAVGGQVFSYQNNHLSGNVSDGAPTAVLTLR